MSAVSLRILLIATEAPPVSGGIARQIGYIELVLRERGHLVETLAYPEVGRIAFMGMRFSSLPLKLFKRLPHMHQYDVIHIHGATPTVSDISLLLALACRRRQGKRPLIVYTHHMDVFYRPGGFLNRIYNGLHHRLSARADLVIATTHDAIQGLKHYRKGAVFPNAVDVGFFETSAAKDERFTVLFVGQFRPYKGVRVLMQALSRLRGVRLVIAGSGPEEQRYRDLAARLGVDVEFHVGVGDAQLRVLYQRAHVIVLPSVSRAEAFGMVLVEGMASGCVPVASDLPGVREVVGRDGFLCPSGDASQLAEVIERLRDDPELVELISRRARNRARRFDRYAVFGDFETVITGEALRQRLKSTGQTKRRYSTEPSDQAVLSDAVSEYNASGLQRVRTRVELSEHVMRGWPLEAAVRDVAKRVTSMRIAAVPRRSKPLWETSMDISEQPTDKHVAAQLTSLSRWPVTLYHVLRGSHVAAIGAMARLTSAKASLSIYLDRGNADQPAANMNVVDRGEGPVPDVSQDVADAPTLHVVAVCAPPAQRQKRAPGDPGHEMHSGRERIPLSIVALLAAVLTFLIQGYRVGFSPDLLSDEGVYMGISRNLARGAGFEVLGRMFMYHPPLFMWLEGACIKLLGLENADPLAVTLSVRYVNVVYAACTAVIVLLFGRKLGGYRAALVAVALYIMDAYVQRINRHNMLETLAMLCALTGVFLFFTYHPRLPTWQRIAAGVAMGLAALTKEPMFFELLALCVYVVLFKRSQLRDIVWVATITFGFYLVYPLYLFAQGTGAAYVAFKAGEIGKVPASLLTLVDSFVTQVHSNSHLVSPSSGPQNILRLVSQYGVTYLLIGLGVAFSVLLFRTFRGDPAARYLATWSVCSIAIGFILGRISDQYFYYLVVPMFLVIGYTFARAGAALGGIPRAWAPPPSKRTLTGLGRGGLSAVSRALHLALVPALAVMLVVDGVLWVQTTVLGTDDAYIQVMEYIKTHLPPGTIIDASDDAALYYLTPTYTVRLDRQPEAFLVRPERYLILSSKDAVEGFNNTTPAFYNWALANSRPLFVRYDASFWTIGLYELKDIAQPSRPQPCPGKPGRIGQCSSIAVLSRAEASSWLASWSVSQEDST